MPLTRRDILVAGTTTIGIGALRSSRAAARKLTLKISTPIGTYQKMLGELARRFTSANPDIVIEFVAKGENWDPLLQTTLRDGLISDLPDGTWQSLTYAPLLARRGYAQPFDSVAGGSTVFAELGLSSALLEAVSAGGEIHAMPFGTTVPVIYYNMDLLNRVGYTSPSLPSTWEDIIALGVKVAALDRTINGGFVEYDASNAWMFQNLIATFGGRMMKSDLSEIAFDTAEGLRALEVVWRFGEVSTVNMTREQARQAFNAGACGILVRSASGVTSVAKAAHGRFEMKVGRLPVPAAGGQLVGAAHGFMMFTKDWERQKALWAFLRFAAGPEGQMILARHTGYLPVNLMALKDPAFRNQYLAVNPYHAAILDQLAITTDQVSFSSDNAVKITDMMTELIRLVLVHRIQPKAALATMAEQTRKLLNA
ncbi:multiple sugar transport system substrate-binding protein [Bradyrhizobium sp. USDA 4532]|uniref:extracellular solute-binding protein n=1 Tax=unclassified Bradyrhizobium TaxID=2631580 RepID=UPI00209D9CF1|nr:MULTISPECIES: extracellular solute-binding protein [unclassified Bradyrhizobium]MCP1835456.1 multiple sugar transport system substrate-binding protein [Bradyrhizobium sp. USDA 4545]MCP1920202.1 multiple sugar transport system substrate-binding protein [Bradyrhizobium sp. USDA 4532]